jgi:hypothetical protein
MTLSNFATTDDVAALLQRDLTASELVWANRLLTQASDVVRRYTRQTLNFVQNEIAVLPGTWENSLAIPQRPVVAVNSVRFNGVTLPSATYVLKDDTLFLSSGSYQPDFGPMNWGNYGLMGPAGSSSGPNYAGPSWQGPGSKVTVDYDHGFQTIPGDITNVTAGLVAMAIASPVGVNQEHVGGYHVVYSRSETGAMRLTDSDKEVLNFYRKRAISSSIAVSR